MPRRPDFEPYQQGKRWIVNVPPSMSADGERHRKSFTSEDAANRYAGKMRASHGSGVSGAMIPATLALQAMEAARILKPSGISLVEAAKQEARSAAASGPRETFKERLDRCLLANEGRWSDVYTRDTHDYTGTTDVHEGTLIINGNISTSSLTTVASGATIGGSGTTGALTVSSGGFIAPGNSPGILSVVGNYTQAGTYTAEINGLVAGTDHDRIDVTGTVDITGGSLSSLFTGTYSANDMIFILLNDGTDAITGTYSGFAQGAVVTTYGGFDWQISYLVDSVGNTFTGGNDIVLMAIPEPKAALLGSLDVLALLRRRRLK